MGTAVLGSDLTAGAKSLGAQEARDGGGDVRGQ